MAGNLSAMFPVRDIRTEPTFSDFIFSLFLYIDAGFLFFAGTKLSPCLPEARAAFQFF
jgi:hypothetical protein